MMSKEPRKESTILNSSILWMVSFKVRYCKITTKNGTMFNIVYTTPTGINDRAQ